MNEISGINEATKQLVATSEAYESSSILAVTTPEEFEKAAAQLKILKDHVKKLEDKRKELVEPYIKGKAALDEFFQQPQELCKSVIEKINSAMNEYKRKEQEKARKLKEELEAKQRKEAEKLQAKIDKATASGDEWKADELREQLAEKSSVPVLVSANIPEVTKCKVTWQFEITDETKIPREFLTPDLVKIGKFVREKQALAKIDGVKTWPKETNY